MAFVLPSDSDPDPTPAAAQPFVLPSDRDEPAPHKGAAAGSFQLPSDADAPAQASAQAAPQGFLSNTPDEGYTTAIPKSLGTSVVQGVSGAAGMVGSLRDLADELGSRIYSVTSGMPIEQSRARSAQLSAQYDKRRLLPDLMKAFPNASDVQGKIAPYTGIYQPTSEAGRLAQTAGAAVVGAALLNPSAGVAGIVPSAAGGFAGQGASDMGADPLLATAIGMVAAGGAGAVGVGDTVATRFSRPAQEAKAGDIILKSAENPEALKASLNNPPAANIPNEKPTTYQVTGDEGIGQLEREVRAASPSVFIKRAADQAEAQMTARNMIQSGAAPEDVGNYFTAQARHLNDQWQTAEERAAQTAQGSATDLGQGQNAASAGQTIANELTPEYQDIQGAAKNQVSALGGQEATNLYGGSMRLQARAAADAAQKRVNEHFDIVPSNVTTSIAPLKQAVDGLYGKMEPADQATVSPAETAIQTAIGQYPDTIPFGSARKIDTLITSSMRNELKSAGFATPAYGRMVQLKGAWEDAISGSVAERVAQDSAAVAAGTMAPEDAMAAKLQAEVDASRLEKNAVASGGGGSPAVSRAGTAANIGLSRTDQSSAGRFSGNQGAQGISGQTLPDPITQAGLDALNTAKSAHKDVINTYRSGPVGAILRKAGTSGSYKMPDYNVPQAVFPKGPGGFTAVQAYRNAVGNDAEAISALHNYAAATLRSAAVDENGVINPKAYAKWKANYGEALRGVPELVPQFDTAAHAANALQKFGKFNPQYAPTAVPELFFAPGEAGAAGVDHLRSLIGPQKADSILGDYATAQMRAAAEKNGSIDPAALRKWNEKFGPAMSRYPELAAKFSNAGKATEAIAQVAAARKQAVSDYEKGMVGRLIGVNDPTTVQRHIGSIFGRKDGVPVMRDLVARAKQDPSGLAMQGIRQAIADHIASKFVSTNKIGGSDIAGLKPSQFVKFLSDNKPILAQAFEPKDMESWGNLANAVDQANRSISGSKLPGGSNTPQDILRALKENSERGPNETVFGRLWKAALISREVLEPGLESAGLGHLALPLSMVGAVGSSVVSAMRNAGTAKVADLVKDAMLHPELAKTYVMRASNKANSGSEVSLAHQLKRLSLFGPSSGVIQRPNQ